jgi:small conductance mechanosensitive channel
MSWGDALELIVIVAAIVGISALVGSWLSGWVASGLERTGLDPMVRRLVARAVRPLLLLIGIVAAVQYLAIDLTPVTAMLGAATLAVGLALQGSLSNVATGALLLTLRPYREGDVVQVAGKTGTVVEQGYFRMTVRTADGILVSLPNNVVFAGAIDNYTHLGQRRIDLQLTFPFDADTRKVVGVLQQVLADHEAVLDEPAPQVAITDLSPRGPVVTARAWVAADQLGAVRSELSHEALKALAKAKLHVAPAPVVVG